MASVDHEIRSKHSAASTMSHERNPQCSKPFPQSSQPVRSHWTNGKRTFASGNRIFWRPCQRVDEECTLPRRRTFSVRVPLQMQNLEYFQSHDSSDSSVPATQRTVSSTRDSDASTTGEGPDDMEIEAYAKKDKGCEGKVEPSRHRRTEDKLLRVRTCWSHGQRLLAQGSEQGHYTQQQGQERQRRRKEQCERCHDSNGVDDDSAVETSASQISRITQNDTWMRMKRRIMNLETSWQRSDTENHSATSKPGTLCTYWWTLVRRSMCALHEILSGWPSNQGSISIRYRRSGQKLKRCGEQSVPMKLRDGRKTWITLQVCEVNGSIVSVGNFCTNGNDRYARSRHEVVSCGTKKLGKCWWTECGTTTLDQTRKGVGASASW